MDPVRDEDEPEYTDRYRCGHCGHTTTIASRLIVFTQILSAILGGAVTGYLFLHHLRQAVISWQLTHGEGVILELGLVLIAALLMIGFGYTLFRALHNVYKRKRYLQAARQS